MKKTILALLILFSTLNARGVIERQGDFIMYSLPISAILTTLLLKDYEGSKQFLKSFALSETSTYLLKRIVREHRPKPHQASPYSFPSGHTSASFVSAAFIHKRYGLEYAIVPYMLATYVAYSRVHAKKHFVHDVVAGAALGIASSWFFTTKYQKVKVMPYSDGDKIGVNVSYKW